MAQIFGKLGLLLVPVGASWMASEYRSRSALKRYAFAITALIVSSIVWMSVSLAAITESLILGVGALVFWTCVIRSLLLRLRALKTAQPIEASSIPFYLIIVPVVLALIQLALAGPATDFIRERAIRNSAPLIEDIERYRAAHGRYPLSIVSLWEDYRPSVIGIREYQYDPSGDAYNLLFENPSFRLGTREIVMYNPLDRQVMTSHALDVLQLTPEQLALDHQRGHYAVHDGPRPHWKYFWYD